MNKPVKPSDGDEKQDISATIKKAVDKTPKPELTENDGKIEAAEHEAAMLDRARRSQIENKGLLEEQKQRRVYANRMFWLLCIWLIAVALIILLSGWSTWEFQLSDSVLITLITGVSVNVIGLFAIVVRYLFYRPSGK